MSVLETRTKLLEDNILFTLRALDAEAFGIRMLKDQKRALHELLALSYEIYKTILSKTPSIDATRFKRAYSEGLLALDNLIQRIKELADSPDRLDYDMLDPDDIVEDKLARELKRVSKLDPAKKKVIPLERRDIGVDCREFRESFKSPGQSGGAFTVTDKPNWEAGHPDFAKLPQWNSGSGKASELIYGYSHFIGKRNAMEDEHLAATLKLDIGGKTIDAPLFAIFDGHGGDEAAKFAKDRLPAILKEAIEKRHRDYEIPISDTQIWFALKEAFVILNETFRKEAQDRIVMGRDNKPVNLGKSNLLAGTTATVTLRLNGKLWVANTGDSRTVLINKDKAIQLSEDAEPSNERFKRGIGNRNGIVVDGRIGFIDPADGEKYPNLGVARAIGDHGPYTVGVSPRPKIVAFPEKDILPGSFLVQACDGYWDVVSTQEIQESFNALNRNPVLITPRAGKNLAEEETQLLANTLVLQAFNYGSVDNISVQVVKL